MTKCNENMTPGSSSKGGYLRVERNVLKASFGDNVELRHLARVLLCVQTFVYFREGVVCFNEATFICHAGEWITSYSEMANLTGLCRKTVKKCLIRLKSAGFLQVKDLINYKLISLNNYNRQKPVSVNTDLPSPIGQPAENESTGDFFGQAMNFYNPNNGQKGMVN
ncbi:MULTISPECIES: hypothetical protein [Parabacteroides]|uniref:Uncharacterized protein n=1 Tax=Parabacteroides gordonii MS-1 = DSM 23371 TaxID=1203610 RepID=A0A0F5IVM6_9BACT|nr:MULTISPECIES: hypothetical protein [Parabacteroides]KKB49197.1 hypothetical protein HMPREF1536_04261 [Parabacteroides gordonii MS-1 = DSM 23371]KKB51448.1 hypothetical protein HMPREF1212_02178 [Parabacteroides sp. HGS0025]MCA5585468.1 hypothetical protein [Parabacteroides gordonii]RGP16765.1 hypothetical protein DXB27_08570 [Parabacteroides gordonii]